MVSAMPNHVTPASKVAKNSADHRWKLVGPWYRWKTAGMPADGRKSRPEIQKYASDDFIAEFLAQPQHSLRYDTQVDVVQRVDLIAAGVTSGKLAGKLAGLFAVKNDKLGTPLSPEELKDPAKLGDALKAGLKNTRLTPGSMRKLFLPTHGRHYLVVCELHCEAPGFPSTNPDKVCQMGFVVRRCRTEIAKAKIGDFQKQLDKQNLALAALAELEEASPLRPNFQKRRAKHIAELKAKGEYVDLLEAAKARVLETRQQMALWRMRNGVITTREGWFSADGKADAETGSWQSVEDAPQDLNEHFFPLYRVFPDPGNPQHDATGRTLFFGVVPTQSLQHERDGKTRFDDRATYEIRCFVRRHNCCCPKGARTPDCKGELVWSEPTEAFRIAAPFDLDGCSNRPVTIRMPDLKELAAQAIARPRGKLSPVKFIQPQHMMPQVDGNAISGGKMGGEAICFFSIPLITIIALFVLNLFLPIVVFIFNLWFLLVFRFCIPPSISVDLDVAAALDVVPPSVDLDIEAKVEIEGNLLTPEDLHEQLAKELEKALASENGGQGIDPDTRAALDNLSNEALASMTQNAADAARMPDENALAELKDASVPGVDYAALDYYDPVTSHWKPVEGRA